MKKSTSLFACSKFFIIVIISVLFIPSILSAQTPSWAFEGGTGSANAEFAKSVCVDASGNVYVIGSFSNTNDFDFGAGSSPLTSSGSNDGFFASYTSTGVFRWAVKVGGSTAFDNNLQSGAICTDGTNVYVTGNYNGAGVTLGSTVLPTSTGADTYVAKLNASTGATVWTVTYGGSGNNDQGQGICLDPSGNVYVVGTYNNTMTTACGASANAGANPDLYIIKFNSGGTCQWMSTGGAAGSGDGGAGSGIAYVPSVNEVVVASSFSTNATYGTLTLTNNGNAGNNDLCILELNASSGTFLTAVGAGSTSNINANDDACAITYDPVTGDVFATGGFSGDVAFPGAGTLVNNGNTLDMWVARYSITNNNFTWAKASTGSSTDRGYGITNDGSGSVVVSAGYSSPTFTLGSFVLTNTNSSALEDVCIASYAGSNGAEQWQLKNTNTGTQPVGSNGRGISYQTGTGKYWVCGAFAQGCQFGSLGTMNSSGFADWYIAKLNAPPVLSATQSQVNLTCNGVCNGSATVVASGGIAPYTYSWSPSGGSGATASGLCATNYTCTITDANSTSITKTFSITQPPAITSSVVTQTNVSCNGGNNGTATITSAGGTGTRTFSWSPSPGAGQGTVSVTGLTAQVYTCTITDANSCSHQQTVNITQPPAINSSVSSQTNLSCNGGSNGAATVSASGGTGAFTYSWSPSGGTAATATGLTAQNYTCTITDATGCSHQQTVNITAPSAITSSVSSQTNISCNGGGNGSATVSASGGTGAFTYSWSPSGGTGATATGLTAQNYTCTITDANSCTHQQTVSITAPSVITSSISSQTNISCNGGSNGSATVSASGGTGAFTYSWSPSGATGATATGLTAQNYTCTITDANSCTHQQTVSITAPSAITSSISSQTNISCNGGSNGSATVSASGGTGAFTYSWSPSGGTAATATGLTAQNYTCTITDANSCTKTQTVNITAPTAITSSVSAQTNISCNGGSNGSATVSASGGTGAFTYSWSPSGGTGTTATGLTAQNYTCTITDANSCSHQQTVSITAPSAITSSISSQTNISCNGGSNGSATVSASGGTGAFTYSWSPSGGTGATATGLTAQNYTCTITDVNSCTHQQTVSITEPSAITSSVSSQTNISCNGGSNGSATISASGGTGAFTYSWSPSGGTAATATGLTAQNYTCTITDVNSCTHQQTVSITEPSAITSSVSSQTNISCNGGSNGSATISASGGTGAVTYFWSPSGGTAATATGLTAQNYTCTITDANSCTHQQTVSITEPSAITSSISSQTNISCNGGSNGSATVSASGGTGAFTYSWLPSGGTAATTTGLTAQNYTCTITDANSCTHQQTVSITEPSVITSSVSSQTNISCNGGNNGSATVSASGGTGAFTYSWSPSGGTAATATGLTAQNYTCTITDLNGCVKTQTVTITEPSILTSTSSSTPATCGGSSGSATAVASGGVASYTYSWSPSGGTGSTASSLIAGDYTCTITDANGCTTTTSVTVNSTGGITASITAVTPVSCNGGSDGSATAAPNGGTGPYAYAWTPSGGSSSTETGLPVGSYTCTITDFNGCSASASVSITQPTIITATTSQTDVSCNGNANGTATVIASGGTPGYTYSWTPSGGNAATASSLSPATYTCTITDANGCNLTQTFNITEPAILTGIPSQTNVSCNGGNNGSATLTVNGGTQAYTYVWTPSGGNAATASSLAQGTYTCSVTDANGCTLTQSFTITQPSAVTVAMSKTDASCAASDGTATATPSGGTGAYTYSWMPGGQTTQTATNLSAATYTCTVTDANGCSVTGSVTVNSTGCGPTQLVQCGATLSTLNQTINCVAVQGATNYQYKIMQGATTISLYTRGNNLTNIVLSNISAIMYGQTYQISVRAMVNSAWGSYGPACNITTPAFPPGQVSLSSCGTSLTSFTSPINCNSIVGATNYQWKFMQGATLISVYTRGTGLTDCQLVNVGSVQYGQTYDVYVRAFVGGVWGPYGTFCNVTSPPFPTTQVSAAYCGATLATVNSGFSCDAVPGATNYQWKVVNTALNYSSIVTSSNNQNTWRLSNHPGVLGNTTYMVSVRANVGGWGTFGTVCTITTGHSSRLGNPDQDSTEAELNLQVFPNPTTGFVTVDGNGLIINKVIVTDLSGRIVNEFEPENSSFQVNLSDEENGIYFITIFVNDSRKVVKIIKTE